VWRVWGDEIDNCGLFLEQRSRHIFGGGNEMRKGFTRRPKADEPATQGKKYITPSELQRLSTVSPSTSQSPPYWNVSGHATPESAGGHHPVREPVEIMRILRCSGEAI